MQQSLASQGTVSGMKRPTVFVGSSTEGKRIADQVRDQIKDVATIRAWDDGPFELSRAFIESLVSAANEYDFAILVLTPDDLVSSRGDVQRSPRDNVLFECGLFMGRLGRHRTFLVYDLDRPLKLPSDLAGVKYAGFHGKKRPADLTLAIRKACLPIRKAICALGANRAFSATETRVGKDRRHFFERLNPQGWLQQVELRELPDGVAVKLRDTTLGVRHGRIEEVAPDDTRAVVLPVNEFFDRECFDDARTAVGAFAGAHFPDQYDALHDLARQQLAGAPTDVVARRPGVMLPSYGAGKCIFLDRPLQSKHRLILAAVTTDRASTGLECEVPFLHQALKQIESILATNRMSSVAMPLMGAGAGNLRREVALFTLILGLSELPRRRIRAAEILIYPPAKGEVEHSMSMIRQTVCAAALMA